MNKLDLALTQNPQLTGFLIYPAVKPAMLQPRYQTTQTKLENEVRFSLPGRAWEEVNYAFLSRCGGVCSTFVYLRQYLCGYC